MPALCMTGRSNKGFNMHPVKLASSVVLFVFFLFVSDASADNEACKMLPVAKFSEIMGYNATVSAASERTCTYSKRPGEAGGMLMIITDKATAAHKARLSAQGPTPFGENGKLGYSYLQGTTLFWVGITGTDPAKVNALADEVKRNLK